MSSFIPNEQLHIDQHLSQIAINFRPVGFFADKIAPIVTVQHQSDLYKVYDQAELWRIDDTVRSPGTEANIYTISVGSDSYLAKNRALKTQVTIEDRANADANFIRDIEEGKVIATTDKIMLDWDRRVALQVNNVSNVGTSSAVASAWTDNANSDPLGDIELVLDQIEDSTGYRPNRAVFGGNSWRELKRNNTFTDKTNKTGFSGAGPRVTENQVKELLELEEVIVARAFFNNAEEGQPLDLQRVFTDNVLVYYAPATASVDVPSFMYSFRWAKNGLPNMNVERHPFDSKLKVDELEVGYYQDEKITGASFGGLILRTDSSN